MILDGGTRDELVVVHYKVHGHPAPPGTSERLLRASVLVAVSPLRLDYEVNRLRGRAFDGDVRCRKASS
jgi:hypothetical protein